MIGPGIVLFAMVVSTFLTILFAMRYRHLEMMAKIDQGYFEEDRNWISKLLLSIVFFLFALGSGFLISYQLTEINLLPTSTALPSCLLISGGLGLIPAYWVYK